MPAMKDDSGPAPPSEPTPPIPRPTPTGPGQPPSAVSGPSESAVTAVPSEPGAPGARLGTFKGVFTPSILTILGVIMYLRFGWVVGNVGLVLTLVIVVTCTAVTFVTALSMASIATDRRVGGGGAYFMISRSLGLETGGAVGIPLYFALALSMALYVIGFAEIVGDMFPHLDQRWVGVVTAVAVAGLALRSADLALRSQYLVMAVIGLSLLSFFLGGPVEAVPAEPVASVDPTPPRIPVGFWVVFAVFFPAVTGIEAGVNMSGDLKDPARSIPRGTLAALAVGFLVYMTMPFFFDAWADSETLLEDPLIMRRLSFWGPLILLGAMGATLSSAMGSILGAPRVLQAMARDEVLPRPLRFLGRGSGEDDAPRVGTVVTLGIALLAIYFGDLNAVAPILTMFFLTSYMTVNFAAGVEGFLQSPSFRPAFRINWVVPMAGAVGCLLIMFLIHAPATIVAAAVVLGVFVWLQRRGLKGTWGDVRSGMWLALVRMGLLRVGEQGDARNWRPHPLVLSGEPTRRWPLVEFADAITHNRGLVTIAKVLPEEDADSERQAEVEARIQAFLKSRGIEAFTRAVGAPDPFTGAKRLVEVYGFGRLVPNTIILGASEKPERRDRYCQMIETFHRKRRNVVVLRDPEDVGFGARRAIDVWWGGLQANGGLMLVLAYLLRTNVDWESAEVRLKLAVKSEEATAEVRGEMEALLADLRIGEVRLDILVAGDRPFSEVLRTASADADIVFLGMAAPGENFREYYDRLQAMSEGLPPTAFVLAAGTLEFAEVLVDRA
jgi:solute carrier family 12 (sodium/potassium/chloride transporter), member 2